MADTTITTRTGIDGSITPRKLVDLGDGTFAEAVIDYAGDYQNINSATTTVVKSGAGVLRKLVFNELVGNGVVTICDNTVASGNLIATITSPTVLLQNQLSIDFNLVFNTGLTVVTSAATDLTVVYV